MNLTVWKRISLTIFAVYVTAIYFLSSNHEICTSISDALGLYYYMRDFCHDFRFLPFFLLGSLVLTILILWENNLKKFLSILKQMWIKYRLVLFYILMFLCYILIVILTWNNKTVVSVLGLIPGTLVSMWGYSQRKLIKNFTLAASAVMSGLISVLLGYILYKILNNNEMKFFMFLIVIIAGATIKLDLQYTINALYDNSDFIKDMEDWCSPNLRQEEAQRWLAAQAKHYRAQREALQRNEQRAGTSDSTIANLAQAVAQAGKEGIVAFGLGAAGTLVGVPGLGAALGGGYIFTSTALQEGGGKLQEWQEDYMRKHGGSLEGFNYTEAGQAALVHGAIAGFIKSALDNK